MDEQDAATDTNAKSSEMTQGNNSNSNNTNRTNYVSNLYYQATSSIRRSGRYAFSMLQRHDSEFSVSSTIYKPSIRPTNNDNEESHDAHLLNVFQGAALLTADCLGTGILALPNDMEVLGLWVGIGFLVLNLPINLYAGTILSDAALHVERRQREENDLYLQQLKQIQPKNASEGKKQDKKTKTAPTDKASGNTNGAMKITNYLSISTDAEEEPSEDSDLDDDESALDGVVIDPFEDEPTATANNRHVHKQLHHDTATFDFIGMTSALFHRPHITKCVLVLFYTNIFLVLGDYILVMSHAVVALIGESNICIPTAGAIACTLMFAVSQLRTMSKLGRSASLISLSALAVVLIQCLWYANVEQQPENDDDEVQKEEHTLLRKLSAMGSIGFAVGSQKLFLNIRRELADRTQAPKSLAMSLSVFGSVYVLIVLLAGANPPGFLFDILPSGFSRRVAGLMLWIHVVVSYAINSQAICASIDRLFFSRFLASHDTDTATSGSSTTPSHDGNTSSSFIHTIRTNSKLRWMVLTGILAISAFFVANAIPFFKDLVALIGALTSVPLTLLLPGIYHRQVLGVPICCPTKSSLVSYGLIIFAVLFMIAALVGSIDSIGEDWMNHKGGFFSCYS